MKFYSSGIRALILEYNLGRKETKAIVKSGKDLVSILRGFNECSRKTAQNLRTLASGTETAIKLRFQLLKLRIRWKGTYYWFFCILDSKIYVEHTDHKSKNDWPAFKNAYISCSGPNV